MLPLAREYMYPIKFVVPSFLFTQFMSAFLRNDGDPALATKAVLAGGIFNMFGNYFFVFTLDRGIMGAGIATSMGSVFSPFIRRFRVPLNAYRDFLSTVVYAIHELMWPFADNILKEPDALGSFLCLKHDVVHNSGNVSYSVCK